MDTCNQVLNCAISSLKIKVLPNGVGEWAVLDLDLFLFIKSELQGGRFAPFCNSSILFHKISVDLMLNSPNLKSYITL